MVCCFSSFKRPGSLNFVMGDRRMFSSASIRKSHISCHSVSSLHLVVWGNDLPFSSQGEEVLGEVEDSMDAAHSAHIDCLSEGQAKAIPRALRMNDKSQRWEDCWQVVSNKKPTWKIERMTQLQQISCARWTPASRQLHLHPWLDSRTMVTLKSISFTLRGWSVDKHDVVWFDVSMQETNISEGIESHQQLQEQTRKDKSGI